MQDPNYNITDGNGDLVGQVGTNSNGDILVEHSSGEQAVLSDSGLAVDAFSTGGLTIGGTLYDEDDNSPIDVSSTSSTTYSVAGTYDEIVLLSRRSAGLAFDEVQVNGDTGSNYENVRNDDSSTTADRWTPIPRLAYSGPTFITGGDGTRITISPTSSGTSTGQTVGGQNTSITPPINQITLSDSFDGSRDAFIRVYGRSI
jgi:hypothetical protein